MILEAEQMGPVFVEKLSTYIERRPNIYSLLLLVKVSREQLTMACNVYTFVRDIRKRKKEREREREREREKKQNPTCLQYCRFLSELEKRAHFVRKNYEVV